MNRDCKQGLRFRLHFAHTVKEWGWFDAYERAQELISVGMSHINEFKKEAHRAHSELIKSRQAHVEHMAHCLNCSRRLVAFDALATIREKLNHSESPSANPLA